MKCLVCARTADVMGMIGACRRSAASSGSPSSCSSTIMAFRISMLDAEGEAKVRIDNLEVMDSTLGRRQLRFVLAWAELHQEELEENWRRARAGETLLDIEPLK
jgi:Domain of unknown function (DUF4160)